MLTLPPVATIGIIGGGQLGMMLVREAQRMGYRSCIWDPASDCPASRLADYTITAPFSDSSAANELAQRSDVITYEFEHIDASIVQKLEQHYQVFPSSTLLSISQHRLREKAALQEFGIPVVEYKYIPSAEHIGTILNALHYPTVVKTATAGYDGKGQSVIRTPLDKERFIASAKELNGEFIVEKFLNLQCEISVIVARGKDGTSVTFPVAENEHRENILHISRVPARISTELQQEAVRLAHSIAVRLNLIGVLCIEMFVTENNSLIVNELAPRPHNSGHYSLDACTISQFEAVIRTICGLPLPAPQLLSPCAMINILGKHIRGLNVNRLLSIDGVKLHLYGKSKIEPNRKMGHITITAHSPELLQNRLQEIETLLCSVHTASND